MSEPPITKPEIASGTLIDSRYIIRRMLGQGGLGRTYLADDTRRFNETCVLKEFAPFGSGSNGIEKCRDLFRREAKILHKLEHPQIPRFLACFEGEGRLFLVQEYVNGKTYSRLLQERQHQGQTFSEIEVIFWLKKLLPVLEYVHQHQVIHRDISPDNIMLPEDGNLPVLIDFGVGKQIAEINEATRINQTAFAGNMSLVGKVGYAPREQISLGLCSPSSDIYALGVTAIVLLTGKNPSHLMDRYSLDWNWRIYADISDAFARILDRMLADTPKARYQTTGEVIAQLEQLGQSSFSFLTENFYDAPTVVSPDSKLSPTVPPDYEQEPTVVDSIDNRKQLNLLSHTFIENCQQQLAYYIGPMATLIVEDVLATNSQATPHQFVELLAREIPDSQTAMEFIRRIFY
ncbi:serine/threonine-protein kinase [Rivularia sp. UHCC 0363]|uniref:serine/threonine-protein kinase n=1 Tax=Rivularia sp. UHCC 0363 TaxID=3110244 RepID=UPI002B1EEE22|nr:serine/threonine-protein kinase [Rivularia sp. UHCC 0363]MEA5593983.1 serine/threonine-protein kinase [Rivularia sp. UHCC 0363]